jgi:hypothetical protein
MAAAQRQGEPSSIREHARLTPLTAQTLGGWFALPA